MTLLQLLLVLLVVWLIVSIVNSLPALRVQSNPVIWIVLLLLAIVVLATYGGIGFRLR
jgi:hypothetical protein